METSIKSSKLRSLDPEKRERALDDLMRSTNRRVNGELAHLDKVIQEFERQHGVDSATMQKELALGTRSETSEVCRWLMTIELRERLDQVAARLR